MPRGRHQVVHVGIRISEPAYRSTLAHSCFTLTDTNSQEHTPPTAEGSAALGMVTRLCDHRPPHFRHPSPQELAHDPGSILPATGPLFKLPNNLGKKHKRRLHQAVSSSGRVRQVWAHCSHTVPQGAQGFHQECYLPGYKPPPTTGSTQPRPSERPSQWPSNHHLSPQLPQP